MFGCNQDEKKGKLVSILEERDLEVLSVSETEPKGKGKRIV